MSLLDAELAFTLKDYVNGLEYRRTYNEDDNSKQINKKVELSDIYLNFADDLDQGEQKMAEISDASKQYKMKE